MGLNWFLDDNWNSDDKLLYQNLNQTSYSQNFNILNMLEGIGSYLVYRDIPNLLAKYLSQRFNGKHIDMLDFGCSIGTSILRFENVLKKENYQYNIVGIDLNQNALSVARKRLPHVCFKKILKNDPLDNLGKFDLIILNFVLVEMHSDEMYELLHKLKKLLSLRGLLFITSPTEAIYNPKNNWYGINNKFKTNEFVQKNNNIYDTYTENQKVTLQVIDPITNTEINTFYDFFHSQSSYERIYKDLQLALLEQHFPLGLPTDHIPWLSEIHTSRLRIDVLSCE